MLLVKVMAVLAPGMMDESFLEVVSHPGDGVASMKT